ncbi:TlpA family protein disulfide reductase [Mangrovimonas xylaniphaga]|uniref:TlpA family protein disulfide reductase n=1 Tax=Mangrovimonas xylaniphaga TaxID=1645915 RepID=UPI000A9987BC|nr:hypothetical protein [Mangrovimonas xylaniphaga]
MKFYIIPLIVSVFFTGCMDTTLAPEDYAYFGGEIINPKKNYVTLHLEEGQVDTMYLDEENRFFKKIDHVESGLYAFLHGGEYQLVLLEPKDSIMLRLNTLDFDESLVFTGIGSKKNNYLIKSFLEDENEDMHKKEFFQMPPEEFESYLNTKKEEKLAHLNEFLEKYPSSDFFKNIAEANINYNTYFYKEAYPFGYFGDSKLVHYKDLPEHFYNFRKDINYNFKDLRECATYNRFLLAHFNNLALSSYYKNTDQHKYFDRQSLNYNLKKLELIDSLVNVDPIKNYLLKMNVRESLYMTDTPSETNQLLASYLQKTTSDIDKKDIKTVVDKLNRLKPGQPIPDLTLINFNDEPHSLKSLIDKPTIIYFWSSNFDLNHKNLYYRTKKLQDKYPDLNIIAININDENNMYWKNTLKRTKFTPQNEYRFENLNEGIKTLITNSVYTIFLVDGSGQIISSKNSLYSEEFQSNFEKLVAQK